MTPVRPRFSIVVTEATGVTVESVLAQTFGDWELLLIGSAAEPNPATDARIRTVQMSGDNTAAVNLAVAAALGEFVLVLCPGDSLTLNALRELDRATADGVDVVYGDEVACATDEVLPKPDWSPERLRHYDYIGPAVALRTALVRDVGGYRDAFGHAARYDLLLRVSERARRIEHVPTPLVRPGTERRGIDTAAREAVQDHLDRLGVAATVQVGPDPAYLRIARRLDPERLISIVIPTCGQVGTVDGAPRSFVVEAVRSALARTGHRSVEIIVVYDLSTPAETLAELRAVAGDQLVTLEYDRPFNFSEKCNLGVLHARGDVVVLLNDDVEVVSDHWLETLVAPLDEPDVGLTGAKLLYEDGSIQHGGHLYASGSRPPQPLHAYRWWPDVVGPFGDLIINRECSGVTAACVAVRRDVYDEVGGLCEVVPVNFNDVDLSLKVRQVGRRILWMAGCVLKHFESKSRVQSKARESEIEFLNRRWPDSFGHDVYAPWLSYEETVRPHVHRRWER